METPSSVRRVTRSQTLAAVSSASSVSISKKLDDCEMGFSKSRPRTAKNQQDRSALIDITNDSPIVGVAMETPSSAVSKNKNSRLKMTPGSGEALLRGQVKNLLQKVEEEAELSKITMESRPVIRIQGFVNSPTGLLAPTPANTPQIPNLSDDEIISRNGVDCVMIASPVVEEQLRICQVVSDIFEGKEEESCESQKSLSITRSLLLDFSDKSEPSDSSESSSVLTEKSQSASKQKSSSSSSQSVLDDDNSSIWSMQVNASTRDEEDEDYNYEEQEEEEENYYLDGKEEEEEGDDGGDELLDDLCQGMSKMSVETTKTMPEFSGKHTRFEYDSEDELVRETEDRGVRLKGLPTPKGKYYRFEEERRKKKNEILSCVVDLIVVMFCFLLHAFASKFSF